MTAVDYKIEKTNNNNIQKQIRMQIITWTSDKFIEKKKESVKMQNTLDNADPESFKVRFSGKDRFC